MNSANGVLKVMVAVLPDFANFTSEPSTLRSHRGADGLIVLFCRTFLTAYSMSSTVSGSPSDHLRPSRSVIVNSELSALALTDSARLGNPSVPARFHSMRP